MRKAAALQRTLLALMLLPVLLCACKAKQETRDFTQEMRDAAGFAGRVRVTFEDKLYVCAIACSDGSMSALIEEPRLLKGFSVCLEDGSYTVGYNGVAFATRTLPDNVAKVLGPVFSLWESVAAGSGERSAAEATLTYDAGGVSAVCRFDADSGVPLKISVGDGLTVEFIEFTYR